MKPENHNHEEIQKALKEALPRVDAQLQHDLWPAMLRRIQEQPELSVPWYDWALAAAIVAITVLFPRIALLFAYHL
ncbi:MAG TPA: hypothetical protein VKW06_05295 [Candidatus Angelobacter sp.]|nr:hypothetical protein [Candidatus Angelobacter sp.]